MDHRRARSSGKGPPKVPRLTFRIIGLVKGKNYRKPCI